MMFFIFHRYADDFARLRIRNRNQRTIYDLIAFALMGAYWILVCDMVPGKAFFSETVNSADYYGELIVFAVAVLTIPLMKAARAQERAKATRGLTKAK